MYTCGSITVLFYTQEMPTSYQNCFICFLSLSAFRSSHQMFYGAYLYAKSTSPSDMNISYIARHL